MHEWYPWYPALFKADTMHLTAEQDGIYRRLIDHYMETRQPLPANDQALARIAGVDIECWMHASSIIRAFFKQTPDGLLHHKRCDTELDVQDRRSSSRSEIAKNAALKRWQKQGDTCIEHASSMPDAMLGDATRQDKTRQKEKEPKGSQKKFDPPAWVPSDDWAAYVEMRIKIKKPMTERAKQLAVMTLDKLRQQGNDPALVLQQSVMRCYQGLFELKDKPKQKWSPWGSA